MSSFRDRFNRLRGTGTEETGVPEQAKEAVGTALPEQAETGVTEVSDHSVQDVQSAAAERAGMDELALDLLQEWEPYGVRLARNATGEFLVKETRYPLDHRHGIHAFSEWPSAAASLSAFHGDEQVTGMAAASRGGGAANASASAHGQAYMPIQPHNVLFLDLETTGLGAGAGNVPFMLGIAYFESGHYVVRQSLIRHPAEERAMLADLAERLPRFRYLVTYNGRTFDWPVMQSRFIMNGFGSRVWEPLHLDFLHPSRSIWRNTLVSCKLSYVEEERLGVFRVDDLPGSEAPGRYFAYLADGDPSPLADVFRHNQIDMLSLAALAIRFGHLLAGRIGSAVPMPTEAEELVRTGLWLERMGQDASALPLLSSVRAIGQASPSVWNRLAERDKRLGRWADAIALWEKSAAAAEEASLPDWEAHVELSMYYEHRDKNAAKALHYARAALELALGHPPISRASAKRRKEIDALRHRCARLERKALK